MPFPRRISAKNPKTTLLHIVHRGGYVELHDRPVTAAEIMCRYPRCCVTYPNVFQQPWAVVEPDAKLVLGQKYYVVPLSTIRKLQGLSPRSSPSPAHEIATSSSVYEIRNTQSSKEEKDDGMLSTCCVFMNKSTAKKTNNYKHSKNKNHVRNLSTNVNDNNNNGCLLHDNCFVSLLNGGRTKATVGDMTKEIRTSSNRAHPRNDNTLTRRRTQDLTGKGLRSSPKNVWSSSDHWLPSLESITEE
ncbi:hypothetical protein LR48_Vigan05g224500 [Vigna angularis]|uniref:Uncharacterized protein n=1 Tax=Phaseolus angularis TaxID=3914 RepID=A0A0L9UP10_PHAAN|nr:uncharacterized protein HKW66_Vig0211570 [Vigna angularis]KOM44640.1 hypothetical protein LR48_Vigan05g224500 [Vigna angularis]